MPVELDAEGWPVVACPYCGHLGRFHTYGGPGADPEQWHPPYKGDHRWDVRPQYDVRVCRRCGRGFLLPFKIMSDMSLDAEPIAETLWSEWLADDTSA